MIDLLENIKNKYSKKNVQSLCKKLQKKCSFKSENDISNLTDLAFWMYILGDIDNAEKLIDLTKEVVFDGKYNIWDYIHTMWALKARILREKGNIEVAKKISATITANDRKLNKFFDTSEKMERFREDFIKRTTYEGIGYHEEIESELSNGDIKGANIWRFGSIMKYIRYKEEGIYPDLIEKDNQIEEEINEFVKILKLA
ncbi:DUF6707 family protein [Flavobacterium sp. UBA4854]|uniref:DUF6707 family protein n=1 Tax=Flavobacterium sp. UBA4854 TaxID=1946548 RepID=UPI002579875D|nr:DUF6707 family protein [Flavobacterium sp. UBA4854]